MAQSSLVPAQEMPHWMLGVAPSWLLLPFVPCLVIGGLGGEITLFYGTKVHTQKYTKEKTELLRCVHTAWAAQTRCQSPQRPLQGQPEKSSLAAHAQACPSSPHPPPQLIPVRW